MTAAAVVAVAVEAVTVAVGVGLIYYNTSEGVVAPAATDDSSDAALPPSPDDINGPYSDMKDPSSVAPGRDFTRTQKQRIYDANRARNDGKLVDDETGEELVPPQKSRSGVTPPPNEAQVDHIYPRARGGPNSYRNAAVRSRQANREKGDRLPGETRPPSRRRVGPQ